MISCSSFVYIVAYIIIGNIVKPYVINQKQSYDNVNQANVSTASASTTQEHAIKLTTLAPADGTRNTFALQCTQSSNFNWCVNSQATTISSLKKNRNSNHIKSYRQSPKF